MPIMPFRAAPRHELYIGASKSGCTGNADSVDHAGEIAGDGQVSELRNAGAKNACGCGGFFGGRP